jgi:hypothetical protein
MYTWHRVFGRSEREPAPLALCEALAAQGIQVRPRFRGDDDGWFACVLNIEGAKTEVHLERYLVRAEKLRGDVNSWSAWIESRPPSPERELLLDALAATAQSFTLYAEAADEPEAGVSVCVRLCRWLAAEMEGVYQIDGKGFYDATGVLMLEEAA